MLAVASVDPFAQLCVPGVKCAYLVPFLLASFTPLKLLIEYQVLKLELSGVKVIVDNLHVGGWCPALRDVVVHRLDKVVLHKFVRDEQLQGEVGLDLGDCVSTQYDS